MPSLLQSVCRQVHRVMSNDWMPSLTKSIIDCFDSMNRFSNVASQKKFLLSLISSLNGCIIGLMAYAHDTWLTKPNQERAPVMLVGTGKFCMADNIG